MRKCTKCEIIKDEKDFFVKDKTSGRLHTQCKLCYKEHRKTYYRTHYQKYHQAYLDRAKRYRNLLHTEYRNNMLAYLHGKQCAICGEDDIRTFEFDHVEPHEKEFNISQAVKLGYRWGAVEKEISKCRILCANCHKKHTAEQRGWYKTIIQ